LNLNQEGDSENDSKDDSENDSEKNDGGFSRTSRPRITRHREGLYGVRRLSASSSELSDYSKMQRRMEKEFEKVLGSDLEDSDNYEPSVEQPETSSEDSDGRTQKRNKRQTEGRAHSQSQSVSTRKIKKSNIKFISFSLFGVGV